jgi:hypothetical protein
MMTSLFIGGDGGFGGSGGGAADSRWGWRRWLSNKDAAATVWKMQAESILCRNLLFAYLLLIIVNDRGTFLVPPVNGPWFPIRASVLFILGASAIFRTAAYLGRQKRLYELTADARDRITVVDLHPSVSVT